jgi:hypothetical protein
LSLLALLLTIVAAVWLYRRPLPADRFEQRPTSSGFFLAAAFILALALLAFKLLVVDRATTPFRRDASPPVAQSTALQVGELRLEGYNLSRATVAAGETFDIDLALTAVAAPQAEYQSAISLVGPEGLTWSDKATARPRIYEDAAPTPLWQAGHGDGIVTKYGFWKERRRASMIWSSPSLTRKRCNH